MNAPATVRREYATEHRFLARRLAAWAELRGPLVEDATLDAVADGAPSRVLDVGCGTGDFSERLQRTLAIEVVALDLSPRMVELTRARRLPAINADIQALPFANESFGCVVANRVLYHVPDLDRGLAEVVRVLRPSGTLVAVTYSVDHLRELWDQIGESPIEGPFSAEDGQALLGPHFDDVDRRELTGDARFPSTDGILSFLAAYGEFAGVDFRAQLGDVRAPFHATYRHTVFVARIPG